MSLFELHDQGGGIIWMGPIDLLVIIAIALAIRAHLLIQSRKSATSIISNVQQISGLAFAWGAFATLAGFFQAFDALEHTQDTIPFPVICGGLKVALITVLYGNLVYILMGLWLMLLKRLDTSH